MRRAALTTVVADTLKDYSNRTGQTRFVITDTINGSPVQKIIDISGYRP